MNSEKRPEEIRQSRERMGWTQVQLAEKLGVSERTVIRWEAGEAAMSEPAARLLAKLEEE